ncbi:pheophorbide a oxygenase family protein [Klebsormidium nitens]|uniref:Pheophorbide a oxygenase family protein n=1 Tax=Klebsormidium nitens TaxID=105231 RepID=A0A1Y1HNL2_KLENI|nr:pheophorbide a oxygenase family protein [Klebsormidium nitens]|eukprot:GAQ78147.1 pheophorbide a oxygenase family protein [Klebsormidium nitens]
MSSHSKPALTFTSSKQSTSQLHRSLQNKQHSAAFRVSAQSSLSAASEPAGYAQRKSDTRARGDVRTLAVAEAVGRDLGSHEEEEEIEANTGDERELPAFDWKAHWYAVGVVQDMDPSIPHPLTILGQPVVLWYDRNEAKWRCFLDQCPHRLAPLSEGRIDEEGRLQCSYHGWSFEGRGACACIPQAASEGPEAKAAANPRAAVRTFPISEAGGLLFVWPDSDPKAAYKAAYSRLPLTPGVADDWMTSHYARDMEYGYEILVENLVDPAHVPFSHNGVGGINRKSAAPLEFRITRMDHTGFFGRGVSGSFAPNTVGGNEFLAPNRFSYTRTTPRDDGSESNFIITVHVTPRGPGKSRVILSTYAKTLNEKKVKTGLLARVKGFNFRRLLFRFRPRWLTHLVLDAIFDGDAVFLRGQEIALQTTPANASATSAVDERGVRKVDAPREYFMPTPADRFVLAFRQWLNRYAGGGVPWAELGVPELDVKLTSREAVMDRWHQHTTQCTTCSGALEKARTAQKALWVAAALLVAATLVAGQAWGPLARGGLVSLALLSTAAGFALNGLVQRFIYTGYNHAK